MIFLPVKHIGHMGIPCSVFENGHLQQSVKTAFFASESENFCVSVLNDKDTTDFVVLLQWSFLVRCCS